MALGVLPPPKLALPESPSWPGAKKSSSMDVPEHSETASTSSGSKSSTGLAQKFRKKVSDSARWPDIGQGHDSPRIPKSMTSKKADNGHMLLLLKAETKGPPGCRAICTPGNAYVVTNAALRKCCKEGKLREAVEALDLLVQRGCRINQSVFYTTLKRCLAHKDLVLGRHVHTLVVKSGYESDAFLANHMIGMYASHAELEEAMQVFSNVASPNVFMWASIILAHARREPKDAIKLYRKMGESMVKPDNHVFVAVLKACANAADLTTGKDIHADILLRGVRADCVVCNALINMYAKCGSLEDARRCFQSLPTKNVLTWTTMIAAYARHGFGHEALTLYASMQQEGITPADRVTFVCLLQACGSIGALYQGKQIHVQIQDKGLEADLTIGNSLVSMYAKSGSLVDARRVFDNLLTRDVVTWNAMISGYAHQGLGHEALALYANMQFEGINPASRVTFICLLQASASVAALRLGRQLHAQIQESGLEADLVVGNCLVDMYAKCGSLEDAFKVFDRLPTKDVVTWNAMIGGYAQHGFAQKAITLYACMQQGGVILANHVTFVCLLQACASLKSLHDGRQVHFQIQERGLEADLVVCNSLVAMYSKCGSLEDARILFESLPKKDVVTWNAMLSCYVRHGLCQEALALFATMQLDGRLLANRGTFVCLLQGCATVGALQQGKELHTQIQQGNLEADMAVGNCLVDMYVKCGNLKEARQVFDRLPRRDVVTWTGMLNGYAQNSDGKMALQCFEEMRQQGVEPDDTTFSCLLTACSHAGLVHEGQQYFKTMVEDHGIVPTEYHINCLADLLGRSGRINQAEKLLRAALPENNCVVGWTSLLSACKAYGNVDCGRRCFDRLVDLDSQNAVAYVLLANIYSNAGRWRDANEVEALRRSAGANKKPAKACIEVKNKVHEFVVGEERSDISSKLRTVNSRLKQEGGHVPHTQLVLKGLSEQEKEDVLCGHAEKLALAYGLMNTAEGTTLLVTKNLRMCNDCHGSTKIMSRLEKRQIIVRDAHCVHRFNDGACSCGDRP